MRLSQLRRTDALRRQKFAVRDVLSMRLADGEHSDVRIAKARVARRLAAAAAHTSLLPLFVAVEDAIQRGVQHQAAGSGSLRHRLLMRPLTDEQELADGEYEQQHAAEVRRPPPDLRMSHGSSTGLLLASPSHQRCSYPQVAKLLREEVLGSVRPRFMLAPHSLPRKLWDTAALLLIYATLVTVPLQIGELAAAGASPIDGKQDLCRRERLRAR